MSTFEMSYGNDLLLIEKQLAKMSLQDVHWKRLAELKRYRDLHIVLGNNTIVQQVTNEIAKLVIAILRSY